MGTIASLTRMLVFAEAMASSLVPVVADFSGLRVAACLCTGTAKSLVESPFIAGGAGSWGVSSNKYHLLEVTISVPPSSWII